MQSHALNGVCGVRMCAGQGDMLLGKAEVTQVRGWGVMTLCEGTNEKSHGVVNGVFDALQWRAWPHAAQLVAGDWDEDGRGDIVEDAAWPSVCVCGWVGGWVGGASQ
jgi:hypothetical protein